MFPEVRIVLLSNYTFFQHFLLPPIHTLNKCKKIKNKLGRIYSPDSSGESFLMVTHRHIVAGSRSVPTRTPRAGGQLGMGGRRTPPPTVATAATANDGHRGHGADVWMTYATVRNSSTVRCCLLNRTLGHKRRSTNLTSNEIIIMERWVKI